MSHLSSVAALAYSQPTEAVDSVSVTHSFPLEIMQFYVTESIRKLHSRQTVRKEWPGPQARVEGVTHITCPIELTERPVE